MSVANRLSFDGIDRVDAATRLARLTARTEGCWLWLGYRRPKMYGQLRVNGGRLYMAHRVAYWLKHGALSADLDLDHLCRNRGCVNPDHLEAVTHRENVRRGEGTAAKNAVKTNCGRCGHPLTGKNVQVIRRPDATRRRCRHCFNQKRQHDRAQKRAALVAASQAPPG